MTLARMIPRVFKFMRMICPYRKGNMYRTMRCEKVGKNTYRIRINPNNTAPYAVYTNEKWIDKRWGGKPNPNEKWIDEGVQGIVQMLAINLNGEVTSTEGEQERWENKKYYDSIIDSR